MLENSSVWRNTTKLVTHLPTFRIHLIAEESSDKSDDGTHNTNVLKLCPDSEVI